MVFDGLEKNGHFYDPLAKEGKEVFLPWLMDGVVERVDKVVDSMAVVDGEQLSPSCIRSYFSVFGKFMSDQC